MLLRKSLVRVQLLAICSSTESAKPYSHHYRNAQNSWHPSKSSSKKPKEGGLILTLAHNRKIQMAHFLSSTTMAPFPKSGSQLVKCSGKLPMRIYKISVKLINWVQSAKANTWINASCVTCYPWLMLTMPTEKMTSWTITDLFVNNSNNFKVITQFNLGYGVAVLRFYMSDGQMRYVLVDKQLPYAKGARFYSAGQGAAWLPFVEKAYAKFRYCYKGILSVGFVQLAQ